MSRLAVCIAAALLAGCGGPSYMWVRDNTTKADFDRDVAQCEYEATAAVASYSTGPTARSYGGAIAQGFGEGMTMALRKNELGTMCMRARGYAQRPVNMQAVQAAAASPTQVVDTTKYTASAAPPVAPVTTGNVAVLNKASKYAFVAESYAKSAGCQYPVTAMILQTATVETFAVACAAGDQRAIRCENGTCRAT